MSSATEPVWVRIEAFKVLHERSLALHGGPSGVRDEGLLESALERRKNRFHYEGVDDVVELAATYASRFRAITPLSMATSARPFMR